MGEAEEVRELAKLAEKGERYSDMLGYMKRLCEITEYRLSREEQNLLFIAYTNVIGDIRTSLRSLRAVAGTEEQWQQSQTYAEQVCAELVTACKDTEQILEKLLSNATDLELRVSYLRLLGRCNQLLSTDCNEHDAPEKARRYFSQAESLFVQVYSPAHPTRLGLSLSNATYRYDIIGDAIGAITLAQNTFNEAVADLENLTEEHYRDSALILTLLRDNITNWTQP